MSMSTESADVYLGRKTMILGDVNSGKTQYTLKVVETLCHEGYGAQMVAFDLAPETTDGIGGKMHVASPAVLRFNAVVVPPRLTGRDADHIQQLACENARSIDPLLDQVVACGRSILVINDASLYLQAGPLERLMALMNAFSTVIVNAYCGHSFVPAPFTEVERSNVLALSQGCDRVITLGGDGVRCF